ncbi:MAG TPA: NAD(P)/FAD-dependent oxidoreductase [Firmicutes bacterium]|nr:NAD(P)/FAD-dependent oxidoreductase [Bacillota bacterium]
MSKTRIVVLGAGYGGLTCLLALSRRLRSREAELVLVNKHEYHQFITELHKPAAGSADSEYIRIPLGHILGRGRARLVKATVERVDHAGHRLIFDDGGDLAYDKLVVAVGSEPEFFGIPGMEEHALTLRSLNSARTIHEHIEYQLACSKLAKSEEERRACRTFVIGGAGLTGVEMAGELAETLPHLCRRYDIDPADVLVYNIEAVPEIMRDFETELARRAARDLERRGVQLLTGVPIMEVTAEYIKLKDGKVIPTHTVIWSGGVRANDLLEKSGFAVGNRGRAKVDEGLRSATSPDVYVVGDCAEALNPETGRPVAPTAHNAIDQGLVAAKNIVADLTGAPRTVFRPIDLGAVASLGESFAVGKVGRFRLIGRPASVMKEMIELRWIWSLGGLRMVLLRLPRLFHLIRVALRRRAPYRPLIGPGRRSAEPH